MLGTSVPSTKNALPIPVPRVITAVTPGDASPRSEADLRHPGRIGIVDDRNQPSGRPREEVDGVDADPRLVDVRCGLDRPASHHRREGQADRAVHADLVEDFANDTGHRLGRSRRRRKQTDALGSELSGVGVDGRTLYPGASYVDAYDWLQFLFCAHAVSPRRRSVRHLRNGPPEARVSSQNVQAG